MGGNSSSHKEGKKKHKHEGFHEDGVPAVPNEPVLQIPEMIGQSDLLQPRHIHEIASYMQWENKVKWKNLFNSRRDGKSFTVYGTKVCNKGPTLTIIQDADGHVFGGFASESWRPAQQRAKELARERAAVSRAERCGQDYQANPQAKNQSKMFFGTERSFVFSAKPELKVYPATGVNSNFMYYEESSELEGMSGVAMGGQQGFFAWYIDTWLDHGHCRGAPFCTTFKNPPLSGKEKFDVEMVEVWQVNAEEIENDEDTTKVSALNNRKFKEDKVILELAGREFYADKGPA